MLPLVLLASVPVVEVEAGNFDLYLVLSRQESTVVQSRHLRGVSGDTLRFELEEDGVATVGSAHSVVVRSSTGDIVIEAQDGRLSWPAALNVTSLSGDIALEPAPLSVTATSVSGNVRLEGSHPPDASWSDVLYRLQSGSGSVEQLSSVPCDVWLSSVSGDVTLSIQSLPEGTHKYSLYSGTGDVSAILPDTALTGLFSLRLEGFTLESWKPSGREPEQPRVSHYEQQHVRHWGLLSAVDYNRVKGLEFGAGLSAGSKDAHYAAGWGAYDFAPGRWEYSLFLSPRFASNPDFFLEIALFDTTATDDRMYMGWEENALSSLFFRRDYRDYFGMRGISAGVRGEPVSRTETKLSLALVSLYSLAKSTEFSLFWRDTGRADTFRWNPAVVDSPAALLNLSAGYRNEGVALRVTLESGLGLKLSDRELSSESYTFTRVTGYIRLANIGRVYDFIARAYGGWSPYTLPYPFRFQFGGISTVPAAEYKDVQGDAGLLVNLDYALKARAFGATTRIIAFFDAAAASPLGAPLTDNTILDAGMGIEPLGAGVSVRFAKDLLDNSRPVKVFLRIEKRF